MFGFFIDGYFLASIDFSRIQQHSDDYITSASIDAIKKSSNPEMLANTICYLKKHAVIGKGDYIFQVYHAPSNDDQRRSYEDEKQVQDITPFIISALSTHPNPMALAQAIHEMTDGTGTGSLTAIWSKQQHQIRKDHLKYLPLNEDPTLSDLEFTQALISGLAKSHNPLGAVEALRTLNNYPRYNEVLQTTRFPQDVIEAIAISSHPKELANIIEKLHIDGLLNEHSKQILEYCQNNNEEELKTWLSSLYKSKVPTQLPMVGKHLQGDILKINNLHNAYGSVVELPLWLKWSSLLISYHTAQGEPCDDLIKFFEFIDSPTDTVEDYLWVIRTPKQIIRQLCNSLRFLKGIVHTNPKHTAAHLKIMAEHTQTSDMGDLLINLHLIGLIKAFSTEEMLSFNDVVIPPKNN